MVNAAHSGFSIPQMISAAALARRLSISRSQVRKLVREGKLRGAVLKTESGARGGVLLIPVDSVVAFLRERGIVADVAA